MSLPVETQANTKRHVVTITVNEKPVEIVGPKATGLQIKQAAIAQGVAIQLDFVLSQELSHHKTRIIGDSDEVAVHEHSSFLAVAPDDNS